MNDNESLAEFVRTGNETAFAELVLRHVNLIYSAAFRSTQNRGHAEEIAQAVFVILARKAGSLGKMSFSPVGFIKPRDSLPFATAIGTSSAAATLVPASFFKMMWSPLGALSMPRAKAKNEGSEKIGGVDCFVISCVFEPMDMKNGKGNTPKTSSRLWIGKKDFLIHQAESTTEGGSGRPTLSDAAIIKMLEQQKMTATPEAIKALRTQIESAAKNHQGRKFISTQTHKSITVNQPFSEADFGKPN